MSEKNPSPQRLTRRALSEIVGEAYWCTDEKLDPAVFPPEPGRVRLLGAEGEELWVVRYKCETDEEMAYRAACLAELLNRTCDPSEPWYLEDSNAL